MKSHFAQKWSICVVVLSTAATAFMPNSLLHAQESVNIQPDKYAWLEDINGDRQLTWVKAHNEKSAAVIEKDPHFAPLQADALNVLESPDRLPDPGFHGDMIYNTWQDAEHVRGIVRRTTLAGYLKPQPDWQTILDYDALSKKEGKSWVGKGLNCLEPEEDVCLVGLSVGGEDAVTMREFNLKDGSFVENGFELPRGKQRAAWLDKDTLLISRDWGAGTMSQAGYPITVREWKRGEPLESSKEIFRGDTRDNGYGNSPFVVVDGQGHRVAGLLRTLSTFEFEWYLVVPGGTRKLSLPAKSSIGGLIDNQLIVTLREAWTPEGSKIHYAEGTVLTIDADAAKQDPLHLKPEVLFAPTSREFAQQAATTSHHVLLTTLSNVQGRAYVCTREKNGHWTRKTLPVPENVTVRVVATNDLDDHFFLGETGFLTPSSVLLGDAAQGTLKPAKSEKPLFNADNLTVEQSEAISKDGTHVPYFVVHRKDMPLNGNNPTLMTAYGGFEVPMTPGYNAVTGKLWLERGGVFVLANIRGGGEFGPAWHEAGLKTHRQRIYDDFYAVAGDLVKRKITSSRRLGIVGGSNGGLLMGVEFTQHPEMWNAVVIQVPLLDMLGFEHLSAGASWVGEYGSVSVPEQKAFLASISPYNQLKPDAHYPEPLIFTTTKDDRVGPVHARKFAARMEEFNHPFYYDEITEGGHAAGADRKQTARTDAEMYTYLMKKLMD